MLLGGAPKELGRPADRVTVPAGSILVLEPYEVAVTVESGVGPSPVQLDQGQQAGNFGLGGHQVVELAGQPPSVIDQVPRLAEIGGRQIALVQHEVDDGEHFAQPCVELVGIGDAIRNPGFADLPFSARDAPRHGCLGDEEGPCDLRRCEAAHHSQGEGDLGRAGQRGMAAGEDESQPVITFGGHGPSDLGELRSVVVPAAVGVDAPVAGDCEQPRVGAFGNALCGPSLQGGQDGVLDEILGRGEVARDANQGGRKPPGVFPHHVLQLALRGDMVQVGVTANGRGHDSSGRISTRGQPGQLRTMRSASSRSATSTSA